MTAVGGMAGSIGRRAEDVYASLDESSRAAPASCSVGSSRRATGSPTPVVEPVCPSSPTGPARWPIATPPPDCSSPTAIRPLASRPSRSPTRRCSTAGPGSPAGSTTTAAGCTRCSTWPPPPERGTIGSGRPSDLYRGARLEAAIEALDDGRAVSALEREYVDAGRHARDSELRAARRSARRLRRLLAGVAALLVVALVGGLIAYQQRQTAQRNERVAQREEREAALTALTSSAAALRSNRLDLAALLAVEAHRIAPSAATRSALFGTFTRSPGLMRIAHTDLETMGVNLDVSVLPDTDVIVVQDGFGGADVIDTTTGVRRHLEGPVEESGYAWFSVSADGRYAASIWNRATPARTA